MSFNLELIETDQMSVDVKTQLEGVVVYVYTTKHKHMGGYNDLKTSKIINWLIYVI